MNFKFELVSSTLSTLRLRPPSAGEHRGSQGHHVHGGRFGRGTPAEGLSVDLRDWSCRDVRLFFRRLDLLPDYSAALRRSKIDGHRLEALHQDGLLFETLGVTKLGHKKKLVVAIRHLRETTDPSAGGTKNEHHSREGPSNTRGSAEAEVRKNEKSEAERTKATIYHHVEATPGTRVRKVGSSPTPMPRMGGSLVTDDRAFAGVSSPVARADAKWMSTTISCVECRSAISSIGDSGGSGLRSTESLDLPASLSFSPTSSSLSSSSRTSTCPSRENGVHRWRGIQRMSPSMMYSQLFRCVALKCQYGTDISMLRLPVCASDSTDDDEDAAERAPKPEEESVFDLEQYSDEEYQATVTARRRRGWWAHSNYYNCLRMVDLRTIIAETYGRRHLHVYYIDSEGDRVTVDSDASLNYAFRDWSDHAVAAQCTTVPASWRLLLQDPGPVEEGYHHRLHERGVLAGSDPSDCSSPCSPSCSADCAFSFLHASNS